ncbi:MAG: hypothetical protein HYZ53_08310 [Planctomycetes bacterium]|nr:hypothetical protein [Planctomycetota bacterium]
MGGGGNYYDRDVQDGYNRGAAGYSDQAKEKMGRTEADPGLLPKDRRFECSARSPVVYAFDVTGSMGTLPRIIYDKMPLIAGQISECGYLQDPQISLAAVGDILSDRAPIQVCEFSLIRKLDDWLQRIWLEGNGGGQAQESYEYTAYFYARMCDLPAAETPFFMFTGDEGFRETLYGNDLARHFGGKPNAVETTEVFADLKRRFKGNVFLIKRRYSGSEEERIRDQWERALGKEYVVPLASDQAIADVTLGVFALMTGARTLDGYLEDLKTRRAVPQTDERIAEVRKSLARVATLKPMSPAAATTATTTLPPGGGGAPPPLDPGTPPAGKKPGRIF